MILILIDNAGMALTLSFIKNCLPGFMIPKVCRLDLTATIMTGFVQTTPKEAQPTAKDSYDPIFASRARPPLTAVSISSTRLSLFSFVTG